MLLELGLSVQHFISLIPSLVPLLHWAAFLMSIRLWRMLGARGLRSRAMIILPSLTGLLAFVSCAVHWGGGAFPGLSGAGTSWVYDLELGIVLVAGMLLAWRGLAHTDRIRQDLTGSELGYRTIFEMTGTAIMIVGEDDIIELVNYEFERLSGFSKQEIQSKKSWTEFFAGEMMSRLVNDHKLRRQYVHSVPRNYDAWFVNKLHKRREVFITVGMFPGSSRAIFSLIDMTEQKETLQALLNAEERYRGIFENAIEGIFQTTPEGRYLHANPTLARIYGFDSPEAMLREIADISGQIYVEAGRRQEFLDEIHASGEVRNFESQVRRKDGEIIWISENARVVYNGANEICYYEGMVEDITDQKLNELALQSQYQLLQKTIDELETAQSALVEQERLRALGQMASGIAHDFNNTLSPILGFTELLLKRPKNLDDKAKVTRYLEMIHTAATDASNVVRCLREFYRLHNEQEHGLPIDINSLLLEVIQLTQPRWKNQSQANGINIQLLTDLKPVRQVQGIESSLREALTNLIFNAVDALQHGGTVTLASRTEGESVIVEVIDTGAGMDPETRKRCFEPFFTTKGARGTGLGLAMVYGVVTRHGGTISAESEPGRGTTMQIRLPIRERARRPADATVGPQKVSKLNILLIEDDALVREVVCEYLAGDGHTVTEAEHGRDGLEKYDPAIIDLIITDKSMPELNGDLLAQEIRKLNPRQRIIMLTGFGDMMEAVGEIPSGVDAVISKPVTLGALRKGIFQVMTTEPCPA